jgi:hypothetical protein
MKHFLCCCDEYLATEVKDFKKVERNKLYATEKNARCISGIGHLKR